MNNGQPQELGDCDLCIEFAHFLSNSISLERKRKLTKTETRYLGILPSFDVPSINYDLTQMLHCLASKHATVT